MTREMSGSSDTAYTTGLCVASSYRTTCPSPHRPDRKPAIEIQHRPAHNVESAPDAGKNCLKGCVGRKKSARFGKHDRSFIIVTAEIGPGKWVGQSHPAVWGRGQATTSDAWPFCRINRFDSNNNSSGVVTRQRGSRCALTNRTSHTKQQQQHTESDPQRPPDIMASALFFLDLKGKVRMYRQPLLQAHADTPPDPFGAQLPWRHSYECCRQVPSPPF